MPKKEKRRSFAESWKYLRRKKWLDAKGPPLLIDHHAGYEREGDPVDIAFFRSGWEDADFSNLTMPRRYINRSTLERVSFRNTDLNQSFMCWNDFIECDFTDADLSCADMRASLFTNCSFVRCKLVGADLRRSGFEDCDFTSADLRGAVIDTDTDIDLTDELTLILDITDEGPEPKGG
jgi:uncharacterized protein YjbI with pentapeptide repeats